MTTGELILWILLAIYVIASYWLVCYAISHDAKLKGKTFWEEAPPIIILAPLAAPFVLVNIVAVKRYIEPRLKEEEDAEGS